MNFNSEKNEDTSLIISKQQNTIYCYCCKQQDEPIFRIINSKPICKKCVNEIAHLKTRYDLKTCSKLFQSQTCKYYSKIMMNPTSQFDFLISECLICYEKKMLIKCCTNNHYICELCLYIFVQFNFERSTKCFQQDCNTNINFQIVFLYLESEQLNKWLPVTQQIHCIGTHCSALWTVWPTYIKGNVKQLSETQNQCLLCNIIFCAKCRTTHNDFQCNNDIILNNYLQDTKCFRCQICNSLSQPQFCYRNESINKFQDWKSNIYICYVCKRQFCYDCKKESKIMLFSKSQCENCINTYKKWKNKKQKRIPQFKQLVQMFFSLLIMILFAFYSMVFYQIPQVFDFFFQRIDPICQTQKPIKIILIIINLPLILVCMFIFYIFTLIPLAIYNTYTVFISEGLKKNNNNDVDIDF